MTRHHWNGEAENESLLRAIEQSVGLVDHDPRWTERFAAERDRLMNALPGVFVDIAHIGSTPIEGLKAKPIIDLLAGVRPDDLFGLASRLSASGYTSSDAFNRTMTDRQFFMRHANGERTHHLHLVVHGSEAWVDRVAFNQLLKDDPELRGRYESLKRSLAETHADDREAYTEGKSAFIRSAIGRSDRRARPRRPSDPPHPADMPNPIDPSRYRLHCFAQSGNAYKVALMLELAGADWSPVWVDFFHGGTRDPEYKALNVMAEAPVLEHDGLVLAQSGVILDYLAERLGRYGPANADERREILRWTLWDNHKLTANIATLRWMLQFNPAGTFDPAVIAFLRSRATGALKTLEAHMQQRDYVAADRMTIADFSLVGYLYFPTEFDLDWTAFPAVHAWTERIAAAPRWKHPYDLMPGHPLPAS